MKNLLKRKLSITGILIQDPIDNGYTAYFAQFPEVIAEGDTIEEAKSNLFDALIVMLEYKKDEVTSESDFLHLPNVESFELVLA